MLYAGVDLGAKRSRIHVVTAEGQRVFSGWATGEQELRALLATWGTQVSVALEATGGAFFTHDLLKEVVAEVKVAHPRDLRAIAHARIKNDKLDAMKLAELHRGGLIPAVWVPPAENRDQRELLLELARLRRSVRTEKVKIRALLRRWGMSRRVEKPFTKTGLGQLREVPLPPGAQYVLSAKLDRLDWFKTQEKALTRELRQRVPLTRREQLLMTIPGIGPDGARWLSLIIGDEKRFASGRQLSRYFGLVPGERSTGGGTTPKHTGITKEGNRWMRWLLVQGAWAAVRSRKDPTRPWAEMFAGLVDRGKSKGRAIVAVANRLARVALAVLRDQRPYEIRRRLVKEPSPRSISTVRPSV
jgi:transposase